MFLERARVQPACIVLAGVSATSLLPLRSQLAAEQQKAAAVRSGELDRAELRAQQRKRLDLGSRANAGVAARDARDRASIQTEQSRLADSAAALERKAALYDRLASGQERAPEGQYDVDFELKPAPDSLGQAAGVPGGGLVSEDMRAERARQDWEDEVEANRRQELDREDRRHQRREVGALAGRVLVCEGSAAFLTLCTSIQMPSVYRWIFAKLYLLQSVPLDIG